MDLTCFLYIDYNRTKVENQSRVIPNYKLKANLTAYLKTAKADPKKSIPQPFRDQENNSGT